MKRAELIKELTSMGCVFIRHGANHDWYQNPRTKACQPVVGTGRSVTSWPSTSSRCWATETEQEDARNLLSSARDLIVSP